jgi:gliding motility-associated-like protein
MQFKIVNFKSTLRYKHYILFIIASLPTLFAFGQYYEAVQFIENKGQWDSRVKFMAEVPAGEIYIHQAGFTIVQHSPEDWEGLSELRHGHGGHLEAVKKEPTSTRPVAMRSHAYRVDFVGANTAAILEPDKPLANWNNYILGNDPSKWAFECKIYQGITIRNLYPNIDIRYYSENGRLKYDLVVQPGGNPALVKMQYNGVEGLSVKNKQLLIPTSVGTLKELPPYSYQYGAKGKTEVANRYLLKGNTVGFDVKAYDRNVPLVIDPTLIFCSFSGSTRDNWGFTATYGPDGSMYGGGIALEGGFPVSPGAFQLNFGGGTNPVPEDIVIIKLSPDGSQRIYATYIGGSTNEQPHSLIVDAQGNLVIAGRTNSANYPTTGSDFGPTGGYDIIVTKLNATGTALIGSRRIGGKGHDGVNINDTRNGVSSLQRNYGDDGRSEVIIDGANNIYVASNTRSDDFFTKNAVQTKLGGVQDAVVIKMTPDVSDVIFSTYLGGSKDDAGYVLAINPITGNLYVAGGTASADFPGNKAGSIYPTNQGTNPSVDNIDGYIALFSPDGGLQKTTYMGTSGIDQVYGIQFDHRGYPYITGQTTGSWPVQNAAYSNPGAKQFISKLEPDLSAFVYSTVFGKSANEPSISPTAFLVDRCENVYVSGWGGGVSDRSNPYNSSGTIGLPVTPDAIKPTTDGRDFYFFVLQKNATAQLFGSFFGQDGAASDHVDGGTSRFDRNGVVYQAICANCKQFGNAPFPTTPGVWSESNPSPGCNLALVKFEMNFSGVRSGLRSAINGVPRDTAGCVPLTVVFSDTVRNAVSYEWQFGDGSAQVTTSEPSATHTYQRVGTFRVMLVAIDSSTCNVRDTSYINIRVGDIEAKIDFNPVKLEPCDSFRYRFDNLSVAPGSQPFAARSFVWDFGDGSARVTAGTAPVFHQYTTPGTYNVKLILVDSAYCNLGDSVQKTLRVAATVAASFDNPGTGCAPFTANFNNTSLGGQTFLWSFGDGNTSTESSPQHIYTQPGTYRVKLLVTDPNTCNVTDSTAATIIIAGIPTASFTAAPQPPVENTPITFTPNVSPDVVEYRWYFGDGDSLITRVGGPVQHEYNSTGTFTACLVVANAAGCTDTVCAPVETLVRIAVDVPTAFTPNSNDVNSVVVVRGYGIAKMKFTIWSRWGVKVFETADRKIGWDGRYKGTLLPMDVYAYTLEVEFFDGTRVTKKGDITLIR